MSSQRMQFILDGRDNLSRHLDRAGDASDNLARKLLKLGAVGGAPMGAAVVAGTGMMVAGFASAGAAAGAFGAAVKPQLDKVTKASELYTAAQEAQAEGGEKAAAANKAYTDALAKLPPATRDTAKAFVGLKSDYAKWSEEMSKDTMPVFTKGIEGARKALPLLTPLVKTASRSLSEFMDSMDGGGLKGFIGRLNESAKTALPDLLNSGRNVFVGLGGIISAFLPHSDSVTGSIEKGTAAFAKWGQGLENSEGFQRFMEIASEGSGSLKNLALAALDLYDAARPLIGASIDIANGFARFIRWLPPETLSFIAGGLIAIKLATLGVNGALALMSANPVTLAVGAVVLLGAAFVTAWQKSQRFREIASSAMSVVAQVVLGQTRIMLYAMQGFSEMAITSLSALTSTMASAFGWVPGIGPKLKRAATAVETFRTDTSTFFDDAIGKVDAYSREVDRMPEEIRIKGEISDLKAKIAEAKEKLKDPSLTTPERTRLKANIEEWNRQIEAAQAKLAGTPKQHKAKLWAQIGEWNTQITEAKRKLASTPPSRRAKLLADIRDLQRKVDSARTKLNGLNGKTATTYVRTVYSSAYDDNMAKPFRSWRGGPVKLAGGGFPSGGAVRGPGSGTSDSIPAMLSNGEYVIRASSAAKYGRAFLDAVNSGTYSARTGVAGTAAGQGLAAGLTGSVGLVEAASRRMASAVIVGIKGELQISSPSKRTAALAKDVGAGLVKGLTGSRDKIKAVSKDLAKDIWAAFSGSRDNRLVAMVNRQTGRLLAAASKRDRLAATIKRATEFAESTRVKAKQDASLGGMFGSAEDVTAGGIKGQLASRLEKMRRFASYIKELAARGINKTMLREILEMGPEQGYAYASALAGADKATFKAINSTQYAINDAAKSLGRMGADRLYDSGMQAGRGFLEGLKTQQKGIEGLMLFIAKGMQKALRRALGMRSPSTVMARLGAYSTEGLARGLVGAMPVLDSALGAVAGRVAATKPVLGRPAVAGGGGVTVNIHVDGAVVDKLGVARAVREALLEYKRTNGGGNLGLA